MLCINILNQDNLGIRFLLSFFRSFLLRSHDTSNSPFPRYFKRKVDRETLAPERGYGKYTSNMADDEWLQVHAHKDELQRWRKARSLKTTGRKQELIDRVIKAKEDGTKTIEERGTREKKARETRAAEKLRSPSENLPDPKTLNNWTNDLSKLPQIYLVITKL